MENVSADEVVARVEARLGGKYRPTDVAWFAPFRMHRRIVSRLADGQRFLIGDAAHLSSPFGGEGLNAGLHDGYDLAWKLALVLRGQATRSLLDGYTAERRIADHHVLDVSDQVHSSIVDVADAARQGREIHAAVVDPIAAALVRNSRAMIDVDYAGSPLVVDYAKNGATASGPRPGQWYPDWTQFGGTSHHVLVFGTVADAESLARLGRRWSKLVEISHNPSVDPVRAGAPGRRRDHDPSRWPHRLPVPVRRSERVHGARPPPLLVPDSGPQRRSDLKGDFRKCRTTPVDSASRASALS